jgi:hypothetical protein
MKNKLDMVFSAILSGDQTAQIFLEKGTPDQKLAAMRYINAKQALLRFYEISEEEENRCGKAHNNGAGEESCIECQMIKKGI